MTLALVTGANRGIGLALTEALHRRNNQVLAVCRNTSAKLDSLGVEVISGVDLTDADCGTVIAEKVGDRRIDLLINNAGILLWGDSLETPNFDGMFKQFDVNAVGPMRVTFALRGKLAPDAKVAFITSRMGSIGDNGSGGAYGYRMSKAALNIAAVSVARDLSAQGVSVVVLHPGMVKTDMIGGRGQIEPQDAAAGLLSRIDELTPQTSGRFFHQNGEELPW